MFFVFILIGFIFVKLINQFDADVWLEYDLLLSWMFALGGSPWRFSYADCSTTLFISFGSSPYQLRKLAMCIQFAKRL